MKNKENAKKVVMAGIVIVLFSLCTMGINISNERLEQTSASAEDNKIIGWGIKRANNNQQPDVGTDNKKLLDENGGICIGKDMEKFIYLTFDEGYEAGYTENILNTLKANDVKATFFITSHYLNTASELVQRMIDEGHTIGNHTPKYLMPSRQKAIKCKINRLFKVKDSYKIY